MRQNEEQDEGEASHSALQFFPARRTSAPTSLPRQSSPTSNRRAHFTTPHFPSFPATGSSHNSASGLAAMPDSHAVKRSIVLSITCIGL
jgi:hypothetical protein